ncbi:MAG: VOC family protein [Spirochaetes bacterium]|nr:MAG: VOC family protein [Spirochaetota bacterium]
MYAHTNLIAKDYKKLARFYEKVFGCVPVLPERDLSGEWLDRATGIKGVHIRGIHLRLPMGSMESSGSNAAETGSETASGSNNTRKGGRGGGHSAAPTLEIFQYDSLKGGVLGAGGERGRSPADPGFGHIAFTVDDVKAAVEAVFENGGSAVGERTVREIPGAGIIDFQYVRDPEGNIIEVQKWAE